jgi:hypothetical protein
MVWLHGREINMEIQTYFAVAMAWAAWLWSWWQVKFLVGHTLINVAIAVGATIYSGEFVLAKTGEFLYRKLLPFVFIFGVCAVFAEAANLQWLTVAAWAALELILLGDLSDNLARLGISLPKGWTKRQAGE